MTRLTNSKMLVFPIAALALVALTTGCGKSTASTSSDTAVKTDTGAKLPDDFPKDLTIPSNAKITMATPINNGPSVGFQVAFDTSDSTDNVVAALKKGLTDSGWTINQSGPMSGMLTSMGATKATERRELNVQIVDADGKRSVTETVMGPKS